MSEATQQFCTQEDPALMFYGAAGTVTGSMHILRADGKTVAMDCGLYQGRRAEAIRRNNDFAFPAKDLDALLLSHAHIDHSGRIPLLSKKGFGGPIYTTPATTDLCEIMLADSAHIQEEDARYWNKKRAKCKADEIEALYTGEDVKAALKQFQAVDLKAPFRIGDGIEVTFLEAGHILGSACVLVEISKPEPRKILFTGDLGRFHIPILRDPINPLPQVDYLITESTYADRRHNNPTDMKEKLAWIVNQTHKEGGKVIIPAFSVGRTQTVVYYLVQAIKEGLLDPIPIFVDSPLSTNATEVFKKHPECYDEEARDFWMQEGDIFGKAEVKYITDVAESKALNYRNDSHVIIASSGMCEAGRVLHHLKNNVTDEKNTVIIVGFMAQHTLGRRIIERRKELKIYGRMYPLMARVEKLNGFSAHADAVDFETLFAPIAPKLRGAFVVHGEDRQPIAMKKMLNRLGCKNVYTPKSGDIIPLT